MGLDSYVTHKKFNLDVFKIKMNSIKLIKKINKEQKIIDAYGAAAKGNTLLNFLGLNRRHIRYVYDANKLKQNKYLPGSHIKILNPSKLRINKPDYIIILPWNVKREVLKQLNFVKKWGCKFITLIQECL